MSRITAYPDKDASSSEQQTVTYTESGTKRGLDVVPQAQPVLAAFQETPVRVDYQDANTTYYGFLENFSDDPTALSTAQWRIKKETSVGAELITQWADSGSYNNIWDNRTTVAMFPSVWVPAVLSPVNFWDSRSGVFNASEVAASDGEDVAKWVEQIGNATSSNDNLTQTTASVRPQYVASSANFNNLPTITNPASNDYLSQVATSITAQPVSLALIARQGDVVDGASLFAATGAIGISRRGSTLMRVGTTSPNSNFDISWDDTDPHLFVFNFNGSSTEVYFDGVLQTGSGSFGTGGIGQIILPSTVLGGVGSEWAQIMIKDRVLTAAEIQSYYEYAQTVWGIA